MIERARHDHVEFVRSSPLITKCLGRDLADRVGTERFERSSLAHRQLGDRDVTVTIPRAHEQQPAIEFRGPKRFQQIPRSVEIDVEKRLGIAERLGDARQTRQVKHRIGSQLRNLLREFRRADIEVIRQ